MLNQRVTRKIPNENPPRSPSRQATPASRELREVAGLAAKLTPFGGDPERFFLLREEVVTRLLALVEQLETRR